MGICQSCPEFPFVRGVPICPQVHPNLPEVVSLVVEVHLMHGVTMDMVCGLGFAMVFWEKGVQAKMFCKKMENGGLVWRRTEFIC